GTNRRQVAKQVFGTDAEGIVVGIRSFLMDRGLCRGPEVERGTEAMLVLQCGESPGTIADGTVFIDAAQFAAERRAVVDPPFAGDLRLRKRFRAAFSPVHAGVDVEGGGELAQHLGAVLLDVGTHVEARDREAGTRASPPGAG